VKNPIKAGAELVVEVEEAWVELVMVDVVVEVLFQETEAK
jgi:hypothetical protein